jgi:uncharacterized protein (TIGR02117 family)
MKPLIKKAMGFLRKLALWLYVFVSLYFVSAFMLSLITLNSVDPDPANEVTVFLRSNGVHTDIAVPVKNAIKDWSSEIRYSHTKASDSSAAYIAFGWGNKDFYLNTPEWSDLKFSTAFKAAFHIGETAMHTQFYGQLYESGRCRKIQMSNTEYRKLAGYISDSFARDKNGSVQLIPGRHYNENDAFYEANGKYDLFNTCNSWTNGALKVSGQKAAVWALTDTALLHHYSN